MREVLFGAGFRVRGFTAWPSWPMLAATGFHAGGYLSPCPIKRPSEKTVDLFASFPRFIFGQLSGGRYLEKMLEYSSLCCDCPWQDRRWPKPLDFKPRHQRRDVAIEILCP